MIKSIHKSLAARREALANNEEQGFTLIELLVVVIIIGILAAIAIPVYLGVQNNAKDASVQSDVANLKTAVVSMETGTGNLPSSTAVLSGADTFTSAATSAGATLGSDTSSITYTPNGNTSFCIEGTSTTGNTFSATDSTGVTTGIC